ncbi:MAG: LPS-assembly protein LptD [Gammaproteobacteria bacterium]|nr:MAG: LPS-assembly protein LptD [Gammaproteobacteria bacterium]RKZ71842.1 MAG: LPS-assembly protein LptD [Gammaproteobacteria bacterium]
MASALITSVFLAPVMPTRADEPEQQESNWPLCTDSLNIPARPVVEAELEAGDVHVAADDADLEEEGISTLDGNVEITRDDQQTRADHVEFNQIDDTADLEGNIQYWDEAIYLEADKGHIEFNSDTGQFENTRYTIKDNRGRGKSADLEMKMGTETNLRNADYSTCDPADKFWSISASEIHLDHVEEWGKAKNVVLRIKDVPIFYSPYMSFPLSKKRKTGFLTPGAGSSNRSGFEARTPFYWNIAPQMDATLTPRLMTDRGVMLMGEFRHMSKNSMSELSGEFLPSDNDFDDENRSLIRVKHDRRFADRGKFSLDYNRVSDKNYFEDFGNSLGVTSTRFLRQRGDISYSGKLYGGNSWSGRVRLENYQTVDSTIDAVNRPYKRLPQINFYARSPGGSNKFVYNLRSEFTYFDRGDDDTGTVDDVLGARMDLLPSISYPYRTASAFVTPKVALRYTQYDLHSTNTFDSNPNRLLPIVSVDSGVFLERDFSLFGKKSLQTLEPRLFYLYVPEENQDDLPVFDSNLYDFNFDALFREDRFSGADRVGDANQFTVALTSRLLDQDTGREKAYVSLGQIYYLSDREVTLPGDAVRDDNSSPFIAEVGTTLLRHWKLRGNIQWDPHNNETERLLAQAQYKPAANKIINFTYRVRRPSSNVSGVDIEQSDVSFHWPVGRNWSMLGRWNYAVPERKSLEIFGGVEYDSCCWGFRAVARRFLTDVDGDFDTGVFLQIELKGLAGVGRKTVDFLKQKIPGYESEF